MTGFPRRTIGWLLVAYAIVGLALIGLGAFIGLDLASRVERLAGDADATIASAARATEAAADAFANVDASLSEAQASSDAAAALAREASGTLDELALAMEISIFGTRPLAPLAGEFGASADQASDLAETLDAVGRSLADTRADASRIAPELTALSEELVALGSGGTDPSIAPPLRLFVVLLLAWMLVQAVVSLVAGIGLIRARSG